jgi:WD40 repeat protein
MPSEAHHSLATKKTCVCTLQGHRDFVEVLAFHSTAPFVATGGRDSCAKLWLMNADFAVATCVWTMELASRCAFCVHTLALHSTEPFLAIGCSEEGSSGLVKIWRLYTDCIAPTCVCTLQVDQRGDGVESVAFHPTAPYVLTGSSDNTAKLWRLRSKLWRFIPLRPTF